MGRRRRRCSPPALPFVEAHRSPEFLESVAATLDDAGHRARATSPTTSSSRPRRSTASPRTRSARSPSTCTAPTPTSPRSVIAGLAELGGFGLSVPEEYGGFASGGEADYLGMVVATEELSWGSLGVGGSLITRPEILTRALVAGGTEEQKQRWLPRIAAGELMVGVMVTEPDYGSDVAGVTTMAHAGRRRLPHQRREDVGDVRRPRRPADAAGAHRPRPQQVATAGSRCSWSRRTPVPGHAFALEQPEGGTLEGRAIDTIGYRGMHSYEVSFSDWFVPAENLVGGEAGLGKGFYLQMEGFENGRLQTAARAVGLMQAAFDAGLAYAQERVVFGKPVFDYQLSRVKLARMAALIQAGPPVLLRRRRAAWAAARARSSASMVKAYVCRSAEWVTREAMQLHGGMGYAEEFPVSRYFVDARVLSIFEGADETLCLRVIARRLAEQALARLSDRAAEQPRRPPGGSGRCGPPDRARAVLERRVRPGAAVTGRRVRRSGGRGSTATRNARRTGRVAPPVPALGVRRRDHAAGDQRVRRRSRPAATKRPEARRHLRGADRPRPSIPTRPRAALAGNEFVFDVQGHFLDYSGEPATAAGPRLLDRVPAAAVRRGRSRASASRSTTSWKRCSSSSDTSMIVLSALPIAPGGSPLSTAADGRDAPGRGRRRATTSACCCTRRRSRTSATCRRTSTR